jgi:hypothetical protein
MPRIWPGFLAVWVAILLHLTWCVLLLIPSTHAQFSTPVHELVRLVGTQRRAGGLLFFVAAAALCGLAVPPRPAVKIFYLLPQQLALGVSAAGSILAMYHSAYADGVARPATFIIADQLAVVLTWMFHTVALMYLYLIHAGRLTIGGRGE